MYRGRWWRRAQWRRLSSVSGYVHTRWMSSVRAHAERRVGGGGIFRTMSAIVSPARPRSTQESLDTFYSFAGPGAAMCI